MHAITLPDPNAAHAAAPVLRDSLDSDASSVRAMLRRVTDAIEQADGAALARELTHDAIAWNDGQRVTGAESVTTLVMSHRALAPSQQVDFGEPRVAFDGGDAWAQVSWGWTVSAGEAICRVTRQGSEWRISAIDPTGEHRDTPDESFDPRAAMRELDMVASVVALFGASLRAAGAGAFVSDARRGLPILAADGERLPPDLAEARLEELADQIDPTHAAMAACLPSGRALAAFPASNPNFTLHIERTDQWRLVAVECASEQERARHTDDTPKEA